MRRKQALADIGLTGLHRALDLVTREKRSRRMGDDFQLSARAVGHALCEAGTHFGMEVRRSVGHGHIPFLGLRSGRSDHGNGRGGE